MAKLNRLSLRIKFFSQRVMIISINFKQFYAKMNEPN